MLMLTRRIGETVVLELPDLDETIEIVVSSVRGNVARLGIKAPKEVTIARSELIKKTIKVSTIPSR